MKNFLKKIEEIESTFQTTDEKIRAELRGTTEALDGARDRAKALKTSYQAALLKNAPEATRLRVEVSVAEDTVKLLEEMASQLEVELKTGEIIEAQLRRHEAICEAVENQGNVAIHEAIVAAEAARDQYKQALDALVTTQHRVATVARKSYVQTSKLGRSLDAATLVRYDAGQFNVATPDESQSAASFM